MDPLKECLIWIPIYINTNQFLERPLLVLYKLHLIINHDTISNPLTTNTFSGKTNWTIFTHLHLLQQLVSLGQYLKLYLLCSVNEFAKIAFRIFMSEHGRWQFFPSMLHFSFRIRSIEIFIANTASHSHTFPLLHVTMQTCNCRGNWVTIA